MQKNDFIAQEFFNYLVKNGVSSSTLKNYKSDIKHFSDWITRSVKSLGVFAESLTEVTPFINSSTAQSYKSFLESIGSPSKTINRKLSTLRKLSGFLLSNNILHFDFVSETKNIQEAQPKTKTNTNKIETIFKDFQIYLENEKTSKNTIKNYLSDIKQFFSWIDSQKLSN